MGTTCSVVTESGRFRENTRARIVTEFEADGLAIITITAPGWTQRLALSGEHLAAFRQEIDAAEAAWENSLSESRKAAA